MGEDPLVSAMWAAAYVRGLQEGGDGADPRFLQVRSHTPLQLAHAASPRGAPRRTDYS